MYYIYLDKFAPLCNANQISPSQPWEQLSRQEPHRLVDTRTGQVVGSFELTYWNQPVVVLDSGPEPWEHLLASVPHTTRT